MKTPFLQPYQPMSREDEAELIRRGQAGDQSARNAIIMNTSVMAWNIASSGTGGYRGRQKSRTWWR